MSIFRPSPGPARAIPAIPTDPTLRRTTPLDRSRDALGHGIERTLGREVPSVIRPG